MKDINIMQLLLIFLDNESYFFPLWKRDPKPEDECKIQKLFIQMICPRRFRVSSKICVPLFEVYLYNLVTVSKVVDLDIIKNQFPVKSGIHVSYQYSLGGHLYPPDDHSKSLQMPEEGTAALNPFPGDAGKNLQ